MEKRIFKIAGICGIFVPLVIFSCIGLAIADSSWFQWTQHALSDLGVKSNSAILFNSGMVIGGIFTFIFSIGLIKTLHNKIGGYILSLSSLALMGIGLFPETIYEIHVITSASFFIFLTLAFLILGKTMNENEFQRRMGHLAMFFALLAFFSTIFLIPFEGISIPESLSCFPAFVWFMIYGWKIQSISIEIS